MDCNTALGWHCYCYIIGSAVQLIYRLLGGTVGVGWVGQGARYHGRVNPSGVAECIWAVWTIIQHWVGTVTVIAGSGV